MEQLVIVGDAHLGAVPDQIEHALLDVIDRVPTLGDGLYSCDYKGRGGQYRYQSNSRCIRHDYTSLRSRPGSHRGKGASPGAAPAGSGVRAVFNTIAMSV